MYVESDSHVSIIDSSVVSNTAYGRGGGIYIKKSYLFVKRSKIISNRAYQYIREGGGIYLAYSNATMVETVVDSNRAYNKNDSYDTENKGGGMYLYYSNLFMIDCEVTKNDVKDSYGGGVYVGNVSSMYGFGYWSDSNYAGNTKGKDIYFSDMYGLNHSNSKAGNCSSGFTSVGTKPLDIGTFMGYVGAAYSYECVPFPTSMPSMIPSSVPTTQPSCLPSNIPTGMPTCSPSSVPSSMPTYIHRQCHQAHPPQIFRPLYLLPYRMCMVPT